MALGGYVAVFWAMKFLILGPAYPIKLDPPNGMAGWVVAPVSVTFFYFVGVFSYGLAGDLAARKSIYPARMFTLPVTTAALAGWPMLYGTAGRRCSLPPISPGRRRSCGCRTGCRGCA
jgi:hypothetical protein